MINTSELRLGNIILFNGEPIKVMGVHSNSVLLDGVMRTAANDLEVEYNPVPASEDCVQPLPLSESLLNSMKRGPLEIGDTVQHPYHLGSATFSICSDDEGYYIGMSASVGPACITPNHFHYYHQLQNIYFAQYGKEFGVSEQEVKIAWRTAKAFKHI